MRIVFMGTPEFGVPCLQALKDAGHEIVGVFCQPDKPKGRGNKVQICPVKELALRLNIPVFQPKRIRLDGLEDLRALKPELCVTAAFGQILSQENLDVPAIGTVNVHSSLLPKYRGSAPINWALIKGEKVTGVTTMFTDRGMDTGDILLQRTYEIPEDMSASELTKELSSIGADLLIETIRQIEQGTCRRIKQNEAEATYYPMLKKEMGQLDFTLSAQELVQLVRGLEPWPGTYVHTPDGVMKIWKARAALDESGAKPGTILCKNAKDGLKVRCGQGALELIEIQMPGSKRMAVRDYLRGHEIAPDCFEYVKEESL